MYYVLYRININTVLYLYYVLCNPGGRGSMGARADDGLDGADFVPPLLSVYLALGTRLGFYRKLRSHST